MACKWHVEDAAASSSASSSTPSSGGESPRNPMHVFYVWYPELCRRAGSQPLAHVKPAKPKHETVLDFVCDRLRPEEWTPVMAALRLDASLHAIAIRSRTACAFLHDVDSAEKAARMKRRAGSVFTAFVARALHKSLGACIRRSRVLRSLALDGIPVGPVDVALLADAIQHSAQTLRALSLRGTQLGDVGCDILCGALRQLPSIELVDLSGCDLGARSAKAIAGVVRLQQIARYCESWHQSLRYEEPDALPMAGLKRITLNGNPGVGDAGLLHILDELDDDLWIRALDMQRCGLTDAVAARLLDVVEHSRSLAIADFRHNELRPQVIDAVFELLKGRQAGFKWCFSASTLPGSAASTTPSMASSSRCSVFYPPGKSMSAPAAVAPPAAALRRAKTTLTMAKAPPGKMLTTQLQREVAKRERSEKENRRLRLEVARMKAEAAAATKTVKYDALPKKDAKLAGDADAEQENGRKQVAFNIFRTLVKDGDRAGDEDEQEARSYLKEIGQEPAENDDGPAAIGNLVQQNCRQNNKRQLWKRANTAFLQIVH